MRSIHARQRRQPDFGRGFRLAEPRRIDYSLRRDGNLPHDVAYLESYLHDAKILVERLLKPTEEQLVLDLERDCWELGIHSGKDANALYTVRSQLYVSNVTGMEWRVRRAKASRSQLILPDLTISHFRVQVGEWDAPHTILARVGNYHTGWELTLTLGEEFDISLKDRGMPRLIESE